MLSVVYLSLSLNIGFGGQEKYGICLCGWHQTDSLKHLLTVGELVDKGETVGFVFPVCISSSTLHNLVRGVETTRAS